jgi:adenosylmethionine-8-amino-7-oxononanoate aminotransferase
MKNVCQRHGALLILDEVMSGMGRTGSLHAWEQEGVIPDLQTVAKGLGAGFIPIGALLISQKVVQALTDGTGVFIHSQTYQAHPIACAAAYEVQKIFKEGAIENSQVMGSYLGETLKFRLGNHRNVGDIRGRGTFWAVSSNAYPREIQVAI